MSDKVIALGIDQGIANLGFCVIETHRINKSEPAILMSGVLETTNADLLQNRIWYLFEKLDSILTEFTDISIIGTESLFVNNFKNGGRNKSAAIVTTNMITGVIMLLGAKHKKLVKQYTPGSVKKYITGAGDASKGTVEDNLAHIIQKSKAIIQADHQSDAIAIAWTSSMDVIENGLEQLHTDATTSKPSKRSKRPKIVTIKEFLFLSHEVQRVPKKIEHIPYYIDQIGQEPLSLLNTQAISGRFKKNKILIMDLDENTPTLKVGVEVGKKTKLVTEIIPETTWYSVEVKGLERKNINRTYCSLLRKLEKHPEYKANLNGKVMEVISEQIDDKCDVQIFIEVIKRTL